MSETYDALAPHYAEYALRRSSYLQSVDSFVVLHRPSSSDTLLDVGAGTGARGAALARRIGAKHVVLAEPSDEMCKRCREAGADEVWHSSAQVLPSGKRFDVILCLWNVLGHVPKPTDRSAALIRMASLLQDKGRIFLDVNNRHNAAAYGSWRVIARRVIDALAPDPARGDASFDWKIGEKSFPSMGHLFTPCEISSLILGAGLRIVERAGIDYNTGELSRSVFSGQMVFALEKAH